MEIAGILTGLMALSALAFLSVIFAIILYALVFGAPFAPLADNRIKTMMRNLKLKKGQKLVDLGSGDGRVVIAFAKTGVEAHGYEINPVLVALSRYKIRRSGLGDKAFIHFADFWNKDFSGYDAVTVYGINHMMGRLEKKLKKELKPGSLVASNYFKFPNLKSYKEENKVNFYNF
jgi:cyclopropane fatty-acyl-phospholipid synthase-like methyltransferase